MNTTITNSSLPLRGKTLSVNFTHGWVQAYFDILWVDTGLGNFLWSFRRDWYSDIKDMPLYPYHKNNSSQFEPVDYWFFEQTRKGLDGYIGERAAGQRSGIIGFEWWSHLNGEIGDSIIPPFKYSKLWSDGICELTPQQLAEYRIRLAVSNFAKNMETNGGILSRLDELERGLQISFPECPFCANDLPECNMLFGLVQGMLLHQCGLQPILSGWKEGELIFRAALDTTQRVQYHLKDNDSHVIQLKFS